MIKKKFIFDETQLKDLIHDHRYCFISDTISVDGFKVGYMFRENPEDPEDSGWRFFSGTEDDQYIDDPEHIEAFDLNVIAHLDIDVIPYLNAPYETDWKRVANTTKFEPITD